MACREPYQGLHCLWTSQQQSPHLNCSMCITRTCWYLFCSKKSTVVSPQQTARHLRARLGRVLWQKKGMEKLQHCSVVEVLCLEQGNAPFHTPGSECRTRVHSACERTRHQLNVV